MLGGVGLDALTVVHFPGVLTWGDAKISYPQYLHHTTLPIESCYPVAFLPGNSELTRLGTMTLWYKEVLALVEIEYLVYRACGKVCCASHPGPSCEVL